MTGASALARAELLMLARNRTTVVTGVLVPVGAGAMLILNPPPADVPGGVVGGITGLMMVLLAAMTVASTATTTLVARRQQRLLERWRISGTATPAVLAGTLAPAVLLFAVGITIMVAATAAAFDSTVAQPTLLAVAAVLAAALGGAVAFVTAAFTRTVEAAQVTLFPAMAGLLGGGFWALFTRPEDVTWAIRATGGGALVELVRTAWNGSAGLGAAVPSVVMLVGLTTAGVVAATRTFRWNPRG